jgi:hypothetical protein
LGDMSEDYNADRPWGWICGSDAKSVSLSVEAGFSKESPAGAERLGRREPDR